MFDRFCEHFEAALDEEKDFHLISTLLLSKSKEAMRFISSFGGKSFKDGLYRVYKLEDAIKWTRIVTKFFPEYDGLIECFGYDWLGRNFALDLSRTENQEPLVLMLDVGTDNVFEIPVTFLDFHEQEIIDYPNESLAENLYTEWMNGGNKPILSSTCVGYKIPPFIGGEDNESNLEVVDLEVYWEITGQLLVQVRELPEEARINNISIS